MASENKRKKRKKLTAMLWTLAGLFGGHWFYLGQPGMGIFYVVLTILGCFMLASPIITMVLSFINFFQLMGMTDREFDDKYQIIEERE
jgi:TM2 domain-containing membrane protein YozV